MLDVLGENGKLYHHVMAENYLCVPAIIETIIKTEYPHSSIGKYDIANFLGITLPDGVIYQQISNFKVASDTRELGVHLKQDTLNELFAHFELNLHEEYIGINFLDREFFSDTLSYFLSQGKHIVCGFDYNSLYAKGANYVGHVSLVISSNPHTEQVSLLDPGPKDFGIKDVSAYLLYRSIGRAKDGLWLITKD